MLVLTNFMWSMQDQGHVASGGIIVPWHNIGSCPFNTRISSGVCATASTQGFLWKLANCKNLKSVIRSKPTCASELSLKAMDRRRGLFWSNLPSSDSTRLAWMLRTSRLGNCCKSLAVIAINSERNHSTATKLGKNLSIFPGILWTIWFGMRKARTWRLLFPGMWLPAGGIKIGLLIFKIASETRPKIVLLAGIENRIENR